VVGLIEHAGGASAHVVGHDWGGAVAWSVAIGRPEVVDHLVICNAPHPSAFERELTSNPGQLRKSWYVFAFQIPWLPEFLLSLGDAWAIGRLFASAGVDDEAFPPADRRRYREAFARPGAARGAINYYRATVRETLRRLPAGGVGDQPVDVPTLVVWGEQDAALSTDLLDGLEEWVPDLEIRRLPDASHWVQADAPERVTEAILGFVAE
jgi:pimeloyl-ACP methyl ester carboxylesterase